MRRRAPRPAFNAPVGGMLYLMELCTRWRLELTWRTFFSSSVVVLALQALLRACSSSPVCSSVRSSSSRSDMFDLHQK